MSGCTLPQPVCEEKDEAARPQRIASLLASGTEIVCLLGLIDRLVGISHECDYPPEIRNLPVLTQARLDAFAPSAEIDRSVRERIASGLGLYAIDTERLRSLHPDLIITQDQCHVCAVSLEQVRAEVRGWLGADVRIVTLRPLRVADTLADIERVAAATGVAEKGHEVRVRLEERLSRIRNRAPSSGARRPRVMCLEWMDPPILSGNWMPELVEAAGGRSWGPEAGAPSPRIEWRDVAEGEPEVLLVLPCGFGLDRTLAESRALLLREEVRSTPAARDGRIWALDGNAYFNRSGPRLVDSAEILGSVLHPELFGSPPARAARRLAV